MSERRRLEHRPSSVQVSDFTATDAADEDAAVELMIQQSLMPQQSKGFPQRIAGDAEAVSEGTFGQPGPRWKFAAHDQFAKYVDDSLCCARPGEDVPTFVPSENGDIDARDHAGQRSEPRRVMAFSSVSVTDACCWQH